jgi:hypothetical protein
LEGKKSGGLSNTIFSRMARAAVMGQSQGRNAGRAVNHRDWTTATRRACNVGFEENICQMNEALFHRNARIMHGKTECRALSDCQKRMRRDLWEGWFTASKSGRGGQDISGRSWLS